jgi:hypothetical protein
MSGGAVLQQTFRYVGRRLPANARDSVMLALEEGSPGPLDLLYEVGAEARLPSDRILERAAAIFINFCAFNLSDDLSDGECDYLPDPERNGPCVQLILQILFFDLLAEAHLPYSLISRVAKRLMTAGESQLVELRTRKWTAPFSRFVGEGVAGGQWSAYLEIMWFGTRLATRAATIGMNLGIATYVADDISSADCRYATLSKADKRGVVNWACRAVESLHSERLACLEAALKRIDPVLETAIRTKRGAILTSDRRSSARYSEQKEERSPIYL